MFVNTQLFSIITNVIYVFPVWSTDETLKRVICCGLFIFYLLSWNYEVKILAFLASFKAGQNCEKCAKSRVFFLITVEIYF